MSKTPQIRFAGFTDAWEQRKLSDLFEERNEQAPMDEEYPLMAFIANIGVAPKGDRYDRSALVHDEKGKKYKRTEKGDFIYSSNNLETGSIGLNNYGNACISPVYSIFKSKHTVDPEFMGRILLRKEFINQMVSFRQGVVYGQWKIHEDDFLNLDILVPQTTEQQKIGEFFSELDKIITLHQRKCDALQKFKKSMLQKMFPQNGESVPEIRFAGFTDAWEQRKLNEYLTVSTKKNTEDKYDKTDVLSVSGEVGVVNQIEFQGRSFAGASVSNYGVVETGDVVYTKSPLRANPYGIIKANKGKSGIVSTLYAVYKTIQGTANADFIECYFDLDDRLNMYLKPLVNIGARHDMKVTDENALKGGVLFPSYEEQCQIADFFSRLDTLITLHQRKLETLQKMKKSLLQKMFV